MYLIFLLCFCLITLTVLSLCANLFHELQASVLAYGKLNLNNTKKPTTFWAHYLSTLTIPKHYFSHFYVVGLFFGLLCSAELYFKNGFVIYFLHQFDQPTGSRHLSQLQCQIGLFLINLHLTRRVYESNKIEKPSKEAMMHVSHYLAGIGFYGAMVFGTWLEGASHLGVWSTTTVNKGSFKRIQIDNKLIQPGIFFRAPELEYSGCIITFFICKYSPIHMSSYPSLIATHIY